MLMTGVIMKQRLIPRLEANGKADSGDTDIVLVFEDASKKASRSHGSYFSTLDRFRKSKVFSGALRTAKSVQVVHNGADGDAAVFVGLGKAKDFDEERARVAGGTAWTSLMADRARGVRVDADGAFAGAQIRSDRVKATLLAAFAEGMLLGAYRFDRHKTVSNGEPPAGPDRVNFVTRSSQLAKLLRGELASVEPVGPAVNCARDWSNEPSNVGTPDYYAAEARRLAKEYHLKCRVLTEADAKRERMGLFLGVGQGSEREGRIVVLEYDPPRKKKKAKTIAFVGKGITFDSGGISIKPSKQMEEMKHDMTGAATVFAATLLAAKWKVPNRIVTILAFTENMPSGNAIQPGNILKSRSGKTVEVINTDAEGRLILADALDYAQEFKPDAIVDAATLTGAVSIALGKLCCGVMGNDERLVRDLRKAGDATGERIWQLPLFDDYFEDMKSDVADMKNSVNNGYGGTIRGAIFLKQFVKKGVSWAHLDIAATAWDLTHLTYYPKRGASGAYVRTLARFARDF